MDRERERERERNRAWAPKAYLSFAIFRFTAQVLGMGPLVCFMLSRSGDVVARPSVCRLLRSSFWRGEEEEVEEDGFQLTSLYTFYT